MGKTEQGLHAFIDEVSDEAIHASDRSPIPITQWIITPKEDNAEVFYIAHAESGTCLKDAGAEPETEPTPILTDILPSGRGHEPDSTRLWRAVALMARGPATAPNLTPIDDKQFNKFARPAMELLISQWEENRITYNSAKPIYQVASIDKNDIKTLKKNGHKLSKSDEDALLNGGVRIDRQGWIQKTEKGPYFANMQGQVAKKSVWQVNIQTGYTFGAGEIKKKLTESMNSKPPKEIWYEAPK